MRAAYFLNGQTLVGEMPDPVPGKGMALVRTHSCGMCASDLHFLKGGQNVIDISKRFGGPYAQLDFGRAFVPGHEFVGEILDYGPGSLRTVKPGRRVTSMPINFAGPDGHDVIGFSHRCPGGFGEFMLLDENLLVELPDDLDDDLAAMTEPLAVGLEHARRGHPVKDDVCLVVGCGAIGLAVIAGLRLMGIAPIVAADFDPARRAIAEAMGADLTIDPNEGSPYGPLKELGGKAPTVLYECVGLPGLLRQLIEGAGFGARIVMGGYCMEPEQLFVFAAQNKRLTVHFASGEEPQDIKDALRAIADGKVDVRPWLGQRIGVGGVSEALANLAAPGAAVRTVVDPRLP